MNSTRRFFALALFFLATTQGLLAQVSLFSDVPYDAIPGVDPNLLSLDIYVPVGADGTNPVMVMYHGGSFSSGDKTTTGVVSPKMDYYTSLGWVFLSVNYRLTDLDLPLGHPDQVTHPDHIRDVARSVAWTIENIADYGGDPASIVLMGFSAGAQLVALVATDESRLAAEGYALNNLDGVIALDGMYDVPLRYTQFPPPPNHNVLIWGDDPAGWEDMSPALHVQAGRCIPPILVVHQDSPNTVEQSESFVAHLTSAGYNAEAYLAIGLNHPQVGMTVGVAGHPLTQAVDGFLAGLQLDAGPDAGGVGGLAVDPSAEGLTLRWEPSCRCTDSDYTVYEGPLEAVADPASRVALLCSTDQAVEAEVVPPAGDRYYLVAPRSPEGEGSLGRDSDGAERRRGPGECAMTSIAACDR